MYLKLAISGCILCQIIWCTKEKKDNILSWPKTDDIQHVLPCTVTAKIDPPIPLPTKKRGRKAFKLRAAQQKFVNECVKEQCKLNEINA